MHFDVVPVPPSLSVPPLRILRCCASVRLSSVACHVRCSRACPGLTWPIVKVQFVTEPLNPAVLMGRVPHSALKSVSVAPAVPDSVNDHRILAFRWLVGTNMLQVPSVESVNGTACGGCVGFVFKGLPRP